MCGAIFEDVDATERKCRYQLKYELDIYYKKQ